MKNPEYYRLMRDGNFVGFKRVVTEYLPAAGTKWQLDPVEHDEDATQKLSKPAIGAESLKRERLGAVKQRRVTTPKSKEQTEPTDAFEKIQ